jgi:hypothetical protein
MKIQNPAGQWLGRFAHHEKEGVKMSAMLLYGKVVAEAVLNDVYERVKNLE